MSAAVQNAVRGANLGRASPGGRFLFPGRNDKLRAVRERLHAALTGWRERIDDPLRDAAIWDAFVAEQQRWIGGDYRRRDGFRWRYLADFERWRRR